jgi:integrase
VDLDAGTIAVWRSVRAHGDTKHGDTKTVRSRRTLRIPQIAVEALQGQMRRQAEERSRAGELWQEHGLVFTTTVGTPYESHNLRRDFRKVTAAAGLGARWVPKELRTSFVITSRNGSLTFRSASSAWSTNYTRQKSTFGQGQISEFREAAAGDLRDEQPPSWCRRLFTNALPHVE